MAFPATLLLDPNDFHRYRDPNPKSPQALVKAAGLGEVTAANRLGRCYAYAFYFCTEFDPREAAKWFEKALVPVTLFSPPKVTLDADFAIRLGSMARWYRKPYGHQEGAAYDLGRLLMDGQGVPADPVRAAQLLRMAGDRKDAKERLAKLRALGY